MHRFFIFALVAGFSIVAQPGIAASLSAEEICQTMIKQGRGRALTQQNCLCTHAVAESVLDADIRELMYDSWFTGANNMAKVEQLPNQRRVLRQLKKMKRSVQKTCDV